MSEGRLHQKAHACSLLSFHWSAAMRDERARSGYQVVDGAGCAWGCSNRGCCVTRARECSGMGAR